MKYSRLLFHEEDAGGGTGGVDMMDGIGSGDTHTPTEGVEDVKPDVEPKSTFDPSKFASELGASFAETMRKNQPAPAEPAKKEYTPEERKKLLNEWEPDDAFFAKFDNLETRKEAFNEMLRAVRLNSDTISQVRLAELQRQINTQFQPVLTHVQEQQMVAAQGRFDKSYPDLAKDELRPVIKMATDSVVADKMDFKGSEKSAFAEIAKRAEAIVKQFNPAFKLSSGGAAAKKSGGELPTTTSGAGGGGGNGSSSGGSTKGKALGVLGSV